MVSWLHWGPVFCDCLGVAVGLGASGIWLGVLTGSDPQWTPTQLEIDWSVILKTALLCALAYLLLSDLSPRWGYLA